MFNILKKKPTTLFLVAYKFIDDEEIFVETATSAGLASLEADWAVEILDVAKI